MKIKSDEPKKIALAFLSYLKKTKNEDLLSSVIDELKVNLNRRSNVVTITTPGTLNVSDRKKALKFVIKLVENKNVESEFEVDPFLLDGMKIKYNDKVWDMSLLNKVSRFESK